jgi:transposase
MQIDFGYAGRMLDEAGELRKTWAFVATLSWSRHQYVEFVFDQKIEAWLRCHRNAFEYFGGVPERVRIDNLKTGIANAAGTSRKGSMPTVNVPCTMAFSSTRTGQGSQNTKARWSRGVCIT